MHHSIQTGHCRLCHGPTAFLFCQRVLHRHDVPYFRCANCDLIQSEEPWWLGEAYSSAICSFDTGAIARNMLVRLTTAIAWLLNITPQSKCPISAAATAFSSA